MDKIIIMLIASALLAGEVAHADNPCIISGETVADIELQIEEAILAGCRIITIRGSND